MDRGARDIVNGRIGKGMAALLLLAVPLVVAGCHWGATPPPSGREELAGDNAAPTAVQEWLPPVVATEEPEEAEDTSPPDGQGRPSAEAGREAPAPVASAVVPKVEAPVASPPAEAVHPAAGPTPKSVPAPSALEPAPTVHGRASEAGRDATRVSGPSADAHGRASAEEGRDATRVSGPSAHRPKPAVASLPVPSSALKDTRVTSPPGWTRSPEELVYRVDFIGITMGYARFRYQGKVIIAGKPAYHLNVRAWTSGVLSFIYPINETIDYYLDTETLAPIRQEFTQREREKDDVALYNQETGRITYRYRQSGKIRKQVDTIPSVYDPVSVAYYFRWKDLGVENRPRNMYGGRKVYQISSRILGYERIRTEHGEVDTIAVLPVIRRDGKPDNKGDLKIWFSNDERRVPVRLYAKFRKIKDWTLVGELMPPTAKSGG